jgi:hypothetical protein
MTLAAFASLCNSHADIPAFSTPMAYRPALLAMLAMMAMMARE